MTEPVITSKKKVERKDPSKYISHHKGHGRVRPDICIKNVVSGEISRVSRSSGDELVCNGSHTYAKRSEYREALRGVVSKKGKK